MARGFSPGWGAKRKCDASAWYMVEMSKLDAVHGDEFTSAINKQRHMFAVTADDHCT